MMALNNLTRLHIGFFEKKMRCLRSKQYQVVEQWVSINDYTGSFRNYVSKLFSN